MQQCYEGSSSEAGPLSDSQVRRRINERRIASLRWMEIRRLSWAEMFVGPNEQQQINLSISFMEFGIGCRFSSSSLEESIVYCEWNRQAEPMEKEAFAVTDR